MKYLKMFGLLAMAAASLMAFAGSASAATLTAPTGTAYAVGNSLSASLEGSALLKASFAEITCTTSTVSGTVTVNNEEHADGDISTVDFSNCGSATVKTLNNNGTLTIKKASHVVSGTGTEVTVAVAGVSCVYGMGTGTTLGSAVNTETAGTDGVTLAISTRLKKLPPSGFLCASEAEWTANYVVTSPTDAHVD